MIDKQGLDFAETVDKQCRRALLKIGYGYQDDAFLILSDLRAEAQRIMLKAEMEACAGPAGIYDLITLKVDLSNNDSEMNEEDGWEIEMS